jgi:hypothetical protein
VVEKPQPIVVWLLAHQLRLVAGYVDRYRGYDCCACSCPDRALPTLRDVSRSSDTIRTRCSKHANCLLWFKAGSANGSRPTE